MQRLISILFIFVPPFFLQAQNADSIISRLQAVNRTILVKSCDSEDATAISHRAMNVFLSDVTGYLSSKTDLSYFTNYVTFNMAESQLTVYHNFQTASGADVPLKNLLGFGLSANIPNNYSASFLDYRNETGLGLLLGFKRLGKVKTRFYDCSVSPEKPNQKQTMDVLRAGIINSLAVEIKNQEEDFKEALDKTDNEDIQGLPEDSAKAILKKKFYENISESSDEKFATLQAVALIETKNYKLISTHWTGIQLYVPVFSSKYVVAPSLNEDFQQKKSYPAGLMLSHTRLWESSTAGRFFATLSAELLLNNSKMSYDLKKVNYAEYENMGGTDIQHDDELKNNKAYIGTYENFITPSLQYRMVYFPVEYHLGLSLLVQQNFGTCNFLNARIGIPVILINSKKTPAVCFEFYASLTDLTNKSDNSGSPVNKTFVGMSVGIPLSRLMY